MKNVRLSRVLFTFLVLSYYALIGASQKAVIDADTSAILNECADKNTAFLKGKITQSSIKRFLNYYSKVSPQSRALPFVILSFKKADGTNTQNSWTIEHVNDARFPTHMLGRAENFVSWLRKNYTPKKDLKLFYLLAEPYCFGWNLEQRFQNELSALLDSCPLLTSCKHPGLPWTKKGVLIPDHYILVDNFNQQIDALLKNTILTRKSGLNTRKPKILPNFSKRKSKLFFSGGLTGPKFPFSMETIPDNPRLNLLTSLHKFPYINFKITTFADWCHWGKRVMLDYLKANFSHLKSNSVDFFEHAQYKYLLSFDGAGAAWSRPQLIMATGSVLFMSTICEQYFYPLMESNTTHVTLNKDLSNLDELFQSLEANQDLAEQIGQNGRAFAQRFCTKPAIDAYLTAVLTKIESYTDNA